MALTFAHDLFSSARTLVWEDGQAIGSITEEPSARFAAEHFGSVRRFGTKAAAVAYLRAHGRIIVPAPTAQPTNQTCLF